MINLDIIKPGDLTRYGDERWYTTCEGLLIRLDPFEQDHYKIEYLPDTNEVAVIYNGECVHSHIMEPV